MKIWSWSGASNGHTALLAVHDEDYFSDVFMADGSQKTWSKRPQVKPGIERNKKKQLPAGDLSVIVGASVILNKKAHAALSSFLGQFGQFLELDLIDETGLAGGNQPLFFYNVTNIIPCIDFEKSQRDEVGIVVPAFTPHAVPASAQVFKDPLRAKMDIFLNEAAHAELSSLIEQAGLLGSTLRSEA